jgi:hypothetical protein
MLSLLYFVLCAYGLTSVLVYGKIFNRIRPKHCFFHCPACMGFWVGTFLWSVNGFTELFTFDYNFMNVLLLGWLSSGTSYILSMLFADNGLNINFGGEK